MTCCLPLILCTTLDDIKRTKKYHIKLLKYIESYLYNVHIKREGTCIFVGFIFKKCIGLWQVSVPEPSLRLRQDAVVLV